MTKDEYPTKGSLRFVAFSFNLMNFPEKKPTLTDDTFCEWKNTLDEK